MNAQQVLPITVQRNEIVEAVEINQVVLIKAETGSGKSTQIPQFLLERHSAHTENLMIACTQPRRLAAIQLAEHVASKQGSPVGAVVGYNVSGAKRVGVSTQLVYMTEDRLIHEYVKDKYEAARKYKFIFLDEVHEQTTEMIVLLGILRDVLSSTPDLRLIISSATMNVGIFRQLFEREILEIVVPGRLFPVQVHYAKDNVDFSKAASQCAKAVLVATKSDFHGDGDFLVFLHGEEEINECCRLINEGIENTEFSNDRVYPFYASLSQEEQDTVVGARALTSMSGNRYSRNIIVASNLAETALTLFRVIMVFDSGLAKEKWYDYNTNIETMRTVRISQGTAAQRAGRNGRVQEGFCLRLYTENEFEHNMQPFPFAEIQYSRLESTILTLLAVGYSDFTTDRFKIALFNLNMLGAIDDNGRITEKGQAIARFSTEPGLAVALLKSLELECAQHMLTLAAMLTASETSTLFLVPPGQEHEADAVRWALSEVFHDSDHMDMIVLYHSYMNQQPPARKNWCERRFVNPNVMAAATEEREKLQRELFPLDDPVPWTPREYSQQPFDSIMDCLLAGYPQHIAQRNNQSNSYSCALVGSARIHVQAKIPRTSSAGKVHTPATVLYHSLQRTSNAEDGTATFRTVSMLSPL